jgi:hypothetical protein
MLHSAQFVFSPQRTRSALTVTPISAPSFALLGRTDLLCSSSSLETSTDSLQNSKPLPLLFLTTESVESPNYVEFMMALVGMCLLNPRFVSARVLCQMSRILHEMNCAPDILWSCSTFAPVYCTAAAKCSNEGTAYCKCTANYKYCTRGKKAEIAA